MPVGWASLAGMTAVSAGGLAVFPLFPALQAEHGLPTAALGLVAAAGFAAAMAVELLLGPQADRGAAHRMAAAGMAAVAVSLGWFALASATWEFVAARALAGAGAGLYLPAVGALLIRRDPQRSGESLGKLSAADLGGIAAGPLVASLLLEVASADAALWVLAAVTAVVAVPVARGLPADRPATEPATARHGLALDLLRSRPVVGAVLLTVAVMIPVGSYDAIWPRFMADLGAGDLLIGASYTVFALPFMFVATPAGRLADRIGGLGAFLRGLAILTLSIAAYGVLRDPWVVTGIGFVESTGQAAAFVGAAAAIAQAVPPARAGAGQGLARAAGTLVAAAVSVVAAWVYQVAGPTPLFLSTAVAVVAVTAVATRLLRPGRGRRRGPAGTPRRWSRGRP